MKIGEQRRQGDVLLVAVDAIQGQEVKRNHENKLILAHGEKTGHHHFLTGPGVQLYHDSGLSANFLSVTKVDDLTHQTHHPFPIPEGQWVQPTQCEYTPDAFTAVED